jgi:hypothetical protein
MTPRFRSARLLQKQKKRHTSIFNTQNTPKKTQANSQTNGLPLTVRLPGFSDAIEEDEGVLDGAGVDAATAPAP